jgi:glycosyltransferase involved in cell wall biosynthesis
MPAVPGATLAVAGGDDEGIGPGLESLARSLGVAERVLFLGAVHGADRTALLHRSALLVLPSHSENFGNVVLEAMAAGTPVVVSGGVGLAEEVRRSGTGLVTAGDPASLGAALAELLADPDRLSRMGEAGRRAVRERYTWDRVAAAMEGVYRELLDGEAAPAVATPAGSLSRTGARP